MDKNASDGQMEHLSLVLLQRACPRHADPPSIWDTLSQTAATENLFSFYLEKRSLEIAIDIEFKQMKDDPSQ